MFVDDHLNQSMLAGVGAGAALGFAGGMLLSYQVEPNRTVTKALQIFQNFVGGSLVCGGVLAVLSGVSARFSSGSVDGKSYWRNFGIHQLNWLDAISTLGEVIRCIERCCHRMNRS